MIVIRLIVRVKRLWFSTVRFLNGNNSYHGLTPPPPLPQTEQLITVLPEKLHEHDTVIIIIVKGVGDGDGFYRLLINFNQVLTILLFLLVNCPYYNHTQIKMLYDSLV